MNLLVIGDVRGVFLLNFIKYLKEKDSRIIADVLDIYDRKNANPINSNSQIFRHVYEYHRSIRIIDKVPKVRGLFRLLFQLVTEARLLRTESYDIVILFGLWPLTCRVYLRNRFRMPFTVGVIMGSDYFQMGIKKGKNPFIKAVKKLDKILVGNPHLYNQIINENLVDPKRLRQVYFGLEPLGLLEKSKNVSREKAKISMGINPKTLIIVCGYNASPNQQHPAIFEAFKGLNCLPDDHLLIIPLSYGGDAQYKELVKDLLLNTGLKYRIIESFITDDEIVLLRKSTDIFIQVQKSDSFSGSMQENLYCGNIVITGSWLPYEFLKQRGVRFYAIDEVKDLKRNLEILLPDVEAIQMELSQINTSDKFSSGLWQNCINSWYDVLLENKGKPKH